MKSLLSRRAAIDPDVAGDLPAALPSSLPPIADEAEARRVAAALETQGEALAKARAELRRAETELGDLRLERAMGKPVAARAVQELAARRDALEAEVADGELVVAALGERNRAWQDDERRRRYLAGLAAMREVHEAWPAVMERYHECAAALVETARVLMDLRRRYTEHYGPVNAYQHEHGLPAHGLTEPYEPYAVPERCVQVPPMTGRAGWEEFVAEWRKYHP